MAAGVLEPLGMVRPNARSNWKPRASNDEDFKTSIGGAGNLVDGMRYWNTDTHHTREYLEENDEFVDVRVDETVIDYVYREFSFPLAQDTHTEIGEVVKDIFDSYWQIGNIHANVDTGETGLPFDSEMRVELFQAGDPGLGFSYQDFRVYGKLNNDTVDLGVCYISDGSNVLQGSGFSTNLQQYDVIEDDSGNIYQIESVTSDTLAVMYEVAEVNGGGLAVITADRHRPRLQHNVYDGGDTEITMDYDQNVLARIPVVVDRTARINERNDYEVITEPSLFNNNGGGVKVIDSAETITISDVGDLNTNLQDAINNYKNTIIDADITLELPDGNYGSIKEEDLIFTKNGRLIIKPISVRRFDWATFINNVNYAKYGTGTYASGTVTMTLVGNTVTITQQYVSPNFEGHVDVGDIVKVGYVEYTVVSVSGNSIELSGTPTIHGSQSLTIYGKVSFDYFYNYSGRNVAGIYPVHVRLENIYMNRLYVYGGGVRVQNAAANYAYFYAGHSEIYNEYDGSIVTLGLFNDANVTGGYIRIIGYISCGTEWVGSFYSSAVKMGSRSQSPSPLVINQGVGIMNLFRAEIHVDLNNTINTIIENAGNAGVISLRESEIINHDTLFRGQVYYGANGTYGNLDDSVIEGFNEGIHTTKGAKTDSNGATFTNVGTIRTPATSGTIGNDGGMNCFN